MNLLKRVLKVFFHATPSLFVRDDDDRVFELMVDLKTERQPLDSSFMHEIIQDSDQDCACE